MIYWVVKVTLKVDGNEFAGLDHVAHECFDDSWAAYDYTKEHIAKGFRVNVYKGIEHIGSFES